MSKATTKPKPKPTKTVKAEIPKPLLYVKVGGPPANWRSLNVVHKSNGRVIPDVLEADAHNGWVIQAVRINGELQRQGGQLRTRRFDVPIRIEPRV